MRNNKGISMITLIITIIVMIILAAITFMAAGDQVGSAQFSKFASEFGDYATNFANAPVAEVTEALGMAGKATNKAQKIYAAARNVDLKNFDSVLNGIIVPGGYTCTRFQTDIKDATGATVELASSTTPVYEIKSDVMKEYDGKKFYGDANGKETHWVTSKGTVFTLPGYPRTVDGEERMYITADLYYLAGSGDMITADDLVPVEPVKVGGDVVTGSQTAADAADSVTPGEDGNLGEEDEEEIPDFSDQTTIEGCPLKFGRAYVSEELGMALLPFADGGALVGSPWWGWATGNVDYLPAGSLTYNGSEIVLEGTVVATCNESGTEAYYDGYTFTLEPVLLGTNDFCSHSIIRSEAMHYVQTYIKNQSEKYTGDTYCIYCNELVEEGECKHINTEIQNEKEATCTEDGYTGDTICVDCGKITAGTIVSTISHTINSEGICSACNSWIIPEGGKYTTSDKIVYNGGDSIPITYTCSTGDMYVLGNYQYTYNQYRSGSTYYNDEAQNGWSVYCLNNVSIPGPVLETVLGNPVTSMKYTFYNKTAVTMAPTVPSTVTTLYKTFYGCTALSNIKNIFLTNNVTDIDYMFAECKALTDASQLVIPNSVTTMEYTFWNTSLTNNGMPQIPSSVTELYCTFMSCYMLTDLSNYNIPMTVTSLRSTFSGCTGLTNDGLPAIPASVTDMSSTFDGCTSITNLSNFSIPTSVTNMSGTFRYCTNLQVAPAIPNGVLYMMQTFMNCKALTTKPTIPSSVKTSASYIFDGCSQFGY